MNTLGDHIRGRRIDLGLLQKDVAGQIGVCALTITNWESNESQPVVRYMPAIIRFLGYDPSPAASSFHERLAAVRRARGLTQRKLANELGVDPSTIQDWESGLHEPSRQKRKLIDAVLW